MISEAAYYLAQKRQFTTGGALDDWLRAEVAIRDSLVASSQPMDGSDEAPVRHEPR
jgi:hypothetical protein